MNDLESACQRDAASTHDSSTLDPLPDFSRLPLTNQGSVSEEYERADRWRGVTWHKKIFARATPATLALFGMDRDYMVSNQAGFFMLEAHITSSVPLLSDQQVNLYSRLIDRTETRFRFMHFMVLAHPAELAATCEVTGAHIDLGQRRMAPLPPELADRFDELLSQHQALDWSPPVCGAMRP